MLQNFYSVTTYALITTCFVEFLKKFTSFTGSRAFKERRFIVFHERFMHECAGKMLNKRHEINKNCCESVWYTEMDKITQILVILNQKIKIIDNLNDQNQNYAQLWCYITCSSYGIIYEFKDYLNSCSELIIVV